MSTVAHSPAFAKKVGIPQSVGKDFNAHDKGSGILRKANGGAVPMLSNAFGNLVTPRGGLRKYEGGGEVMGQPMFDPPMMQLEPGRAVGGGALGDVLGGLRYDALRASGAQIGAPPKPISPGTLSPPDNVFAPNPDIGPFGMAMMDMHGGGGGGMADGGRVRRFGYGGDVDGSGGYGGDPDASEGGIADTGTGILGWGDPIDAETRERGIGFGRSPSSERGLLGLAGSVVGMGGLGALASVAEMLADAAEARGIATDRDPVTGISAGGTTGALAGPQGAPQLGYRGPGVSLQGGAMDDEIDVPPGALADVPGAALPSLATALPALTLRRPLINPLTYGMGPAAEWLR